MPRLLETPPEKTRSGSKPSRLTRLRTRRAEAKWIPAAMSSRLLASGLERDDLRFRKDNTLAADFDFLLGFQGPLAQLLQAVVEEFRDFFQEMPGSRGTLVIHHELDDAAIVGIDLDGLGVLPANVDDRAGARVEEVAPRAWQEISVTTSLGMSSKWIATRP